VTEYNVFDTFWNASGVGQSNLGEFTIPVGATTHSQVSITGGSTIAYTLTTGTAAVVALVIPVGEEDLADIVESDRAMEEARHRGTKSWRQVKRELGL
jgi:hypothetical protein